MLIGIIGDPGIPEAIKRKVHIYGTFEDFSYDMKYLFLGSVKKKKKYNNFNSNVVKALMVLIAIKQGPYITTKEIAERTDLTIRTVQRNIESLRMAGEFIEYDVNKKDWHLWDDKSQLVDDAKSRLN